MKDKEATEFYGKWRVQLYNCALRILNDPMEAEEVMQDTVIKYIGEADAREKRGLPELSGPQTNVWLRRTCSRGAVDLIRSRKRRRETADDYAKENLAENEGENEALPSDYDPSRDIETVKKALMQLPDIYRVVVSLYLFEGYDYEEIASITDMKEVSVRSRYMRGRNMLAASIRNKIKTR